PQRILLRQANGKAGDAPGCRGTAGLALPAGVILLRGQLAVPGQQRGGRYWEDLCPEPSGEEPCQRGEPGPADRPVPYPSGRAGGTPAAFVPARALYESAAFVPCGPCAGYRPTQDNLFMTLELSAVPAADASLPLARNLSGAATFLCAAAANLAPPMLAEGTP